MFFSRVFGLRGKEGAQPSVANCHRDQEDSKNCRQKRLKKRSICEAQKEIRGWLVKHEHEITFSEALGSSSKNSQHRDESKATNGAYPGAVALFHFLLVRQVHERQLRGLYLRL